MEAKYCWRGSVSRKSNFYWQFDDFEVDNDFLIISGNFKILNFKILKTKPIRFPFSILRLDHFFFRYFFKFFPINQLSYSTKSRKKATYIFAHWTTPDQVIEKMFKFGHWKQRRRFRPSRECLLCFSCRSHSKRSIKIVNFSFAIESFIIGQNFFLGNRSNSNRLSSAIYKNPRQHLQRFFEPWHAYISQRVTFW